MDQLLEKDIATAVRFWPPDLPSFPIETLKFGPHAFDLSTFLGTVGDHATFRFMSQVLYS